MAGSARSILCPNNRTRAQRSGARARARARNRLLSYRDPAFGLRMPLLRNSIVPLDRFLGLASEAVA